METSKGDIVLELFDDKAPIVSAMSLQFTECELVTQDDHEQGLSGF